MSKSNLLLMNDRNPLDVESMECNEAFELIHRLTKILHDDADLKSKLKSILTEYAAFSKASYAWLAFYSHSARCFETAASVELNAESLKKLSGLGITGILSACSAAYSSANRSIIEDTKNTQYESFYKEILGNQVVKALHSTPIKNEKDKSLGIMTLYFNEVHKVSQAELKLSDICVFYLSELLRSVDAQQKLQVSELKFTSMANTAPIMAWVTDKTGYCTFLSKNWTEFTGLTHQIGFGFGWLQAIHPDDRGEIEQIYRLENIRQNAIQLEYRLRDKFNVYRWVLDAISPWHDQNGDFLGYMGAAIDISVRKNQQQSAVEIDSRLEARVMERTIQLEVQSNRLRTLADQIVTAEQSERKRIAAILHDHLQQILVASTFQFAQASSSLKAHDFIGSEEHIDRGREFLCEAIQSARSITTELRPPVLYEDSLNTAFEWLARKLLREHGLEVILDMDEIDVQLSDNLKIMIFESVKELLFNVIKHAQVKCAWLKYQLQFDHTLYVSIEDHGIGWNNSQKVNDNTDFNGGMGLFSMRERLKLINAEFEIVPPKLGGTKIEIRIPLAEPLIHVPVTQVDVPTPYQSIESGIFSKSVIKVLLVDDHPSIREGIAHILNDNAMLLVVSHAEDGMDAIKKAELFQPDVILMDVNMPRLNGIEATRIIKKRYPHIQIIGLSVQDENDVANAMKKAGALTLINKTCSPVELIEAILKSSQQI